jgi:diguanylate cyclase (GGDEF)-like protein
MNLYGLPEFLSYSIIVGIAVVLIRQDRSSHLRYWLIGWIIVLIHAGIYMLLVPGLVEDVFGRGLLAGAGLAFMLAAYYQQSPIETRRLLWQLGLIGLPNIAFAMTSTAYTELNPDGRDLAPFAWLIGLGAACAIWQALDKGETKIQSRVLVALCCVAYGVQIWSLYSYGVLMASQWLMCWTYLAVAFFFLRQARALTMGVVFTALSFVLWGLVFPVYSLLQIHAPTISAHMMWNLPKFLTAASMILVLLEERVSRATHLATHDELTGLPNRRLYEDRFKVALERARRDNSNFAVLIVDLNRFKQVNDTLGHHVGDQLLEMVSRCFLRALRKADTVARTGGDEFTVVLEGVDSLERTGQAVRAMREAIEAPIVLAGAVVEIGASFGAAIYPDDGVTQTELHAVADGRMYADKRRSRSAPSSRDSRARTGRRGAA